MFSITTAISRIQNLEQTLWTPGISAGQQLQTINQALDKLWTFGKWDGLLQELTGLTTSGGILTLAQEYRLLTGLKAYFPTQTPGCNGGCARVSIKSQQWKYSPSANGRDWGCYCGPPWYAFDMGDSDLGPVNPANFSAIVLQDEATGTWYWVTVDNQIITLQNPSATPPTPGTTLYDPVSGNYYTVVIQNQVIGLVLSSTPSNPTGRQYQIPGIPSYIDTLTFNGIAKLRYIYATNTATIVIPDSFEGLVMAVRSIHSYSTGDTERAEEEFDTALKIVERDLGQVIEMEDMGRVTVDYEFSGGSILNLM